MDGLVDLHLHSTCSDGTRSPEELVALAAEAGLAAAVLTDHDTMEGTPRFLAAARAAGLRSLAGMEISADVPRRTVHLLAYGCDPDEPRLAQALARVRGGRAERNARILARLARLGCPVSAEEVRAEAGDAEVVGRPHIAAALVRRGFAEDRAEAFRRFLGRGAPAYEERYRLAPEEALALVAGAGGVVSLAHPASAGYNPAELRRFVGRLAGLGLAGIECLYTGYLPNQVEEYVGLAREFGLLVTGGTDYHGENKPGVRIGVAYGRLRVPLSAFEALEARCAAARAASGTAARACEP